MDEVKIWAIEGSKAVELERAEKAETEKILEDTLVSNPGLLMSGLTLVGRQTPTQGGPLDLLGVDEAGKLVVFELKRGTLSRDAVAQVIDYTSDLAAKGLEDLTRHISTRSGQHGIQKIDDLEEWFSNQFPERDLDSLLPPRMVLVGLGADDATSRMVEFLSNTGVDISLLTFHGFISEGKTLLGKQVEGRAANVTSVPVSNAKRPSRQEKLRIYDERAAALGVTELVNGVREMFRRSLRFQSESASVAAKSRRNFRLSGGAYAFIDLDGENEGIKVGFHPVAVDLVLDEFNCLKGRIPFDSPVSANAPHTDRVDYEVIFPLNSVEDWESRREVLTELTEKVNAAYQAKNEAS